MKILFQIAIFLVLVPIAVVGHGRDFSCPYGKEAACLEYSDKICASGYKCMSESSTCYKKNTCDSRGFVCRSKYFEISGKYNDLLIKCKDIAETHDKIAKDYAGLVDEYNQLLQLYKDLGNCVSYASSADEAKSCLK